MQTLYFIFTFKLSTNTFSYSVQSILPKGFMIVGADVTHPSPQQRTQIPSIAAVSFEYWMVSSYKHNKPL